MSSRLSPPPSLVTNPATSLNLLRSLTPLGVLRRVRATCSKYCRDGKRKQRLRADYHALLVHLPPEVSNYCRLTLAIPTSGIGHVTARRKEMHQEQDQDEQGVKDKGIFECW